MLELIVRLGPLLLSAIVVVSCVAPNPENSERGLDNLQVGMWVEAEGRLVDGAPRLDEIEEIPRKPSDTASKIELIGPVDRTVDGDEIRLLGQPIEINEKTKYENLEHEAVEPFSVGVKDWVRIKARVRKSGQLRAREIRRVEPRKKFKVEGEITAIDTGDRQIRVGTVPLQAPQDTRLRFIAAKQRREGPLSQFFEDEKRSVPFTLQPFDNLLVGGQLTLGASHDRDRDLNSARERDRTTLDTGAKVGMLWLLGEKGSFVHVEGRVVREDEFDEGREDSTTRRQNLTRAYAYWRATDSFRLQVGRQDFDEEREWLYDELLDGARLVAMAGDFDFELSASVGREIAAEQNNTEGTSMFAALSRFHTNEDHFFTGYAIGRKDSSVDRFEPQLYGLRSYSRPWRGLGHWVELAYARGRSGNQDIDGFGYDVGLLYRFDVSMRPTITVGYAYALGRAPGDSRTGFRQTGLQDNNGKFGGVTSFKYYGEVFEPELENMGITTLGIGIRPSRSWSADLIFHHYRQDYLSTTIADTNLRASPNGRDPEIGWEVDFVFGYRRAHWLTAEFVAGRFEPGRAFDNRDPAQRFELQLRFKF